MPRWSKRPPRGSPQLGSTLLQGRCHELVISCDILYGPVRSESRLQGSVHKQARQGGSTMPLQERRAEMSFYPDDPLPQLQQTLATLANLQLRYEIERDYLEDWSGPAEVKDRLVAELDQCHRANRERFVSCLEGLRREVRGLEPATPRRTDH